MNQRTANSVVQMVYSAQFWSGGFMSDSALVNSYLYQKQSDRKQIHRRALILDDHWSDLCALVDGWLDSGYLNTIERSALIAALLEIMFFGMPVNQAKGLFGNATELFADSDVKGFVLSVIDRNLT